MGEPGNPRIPAGFTYLGQFIDHDLTFDPASSLQKQNDPDALVDYRTPAFDLDNIYGRGPDDQPYLYQADGLQDAAWPEAHRQSQRSRHARRPPNVGRRRRTASGADRRPAERRERALSRSSRPPCSGSTTAWPTCSRPLPRPTSPTSSGSSDGTTSGLFSTTSSPRSSAMRRSRPSCPTWRREQRFLDDPPQLKFYSLAEGALPSRGVQCGSVPLRPLHDPPDLPVEPDSSPRRRGASVHLLSRRNKEPRRDFESSRTTGPSSGTCSSRWLPRPTRVPSRVQPAYKIDTSLVNPLGTLPPSVATAVASLAERNLLRGLRMGLPSGQAVARKMGLPVIPDDQLKVGKANNSSDGDQHSPGRGLTRVPRQGSPLVLHPGRGTARLQRRRRDTDAARTGGRPDRR